MGSIEVFCDRLRKFPRDIASPKRGNSSDAEDNEQLRGEGKRGSKTHHCLGLTEPKSSRHCRQAVAKGSLGTHSNSQFGCDLRVRRSCAGMALGRT